ncbi:MAG: ribonuclease HII [Candidatus Berkelbacteria bacterium]|nr:ribonuclease HII [Candidatus Berkelbacteria bacterium]
MPNFEYELRLCSEKVSHIAGVDEVGRGALAGPIVAAAVVFDNHNELMDKLKGITDSKVLSEKKRDEFDPLIKSLALEYGFGLVSSIEIDKFGIGAANIIAFKRALDSLKKCDFALIDGRKFRGFEYQYLCLEKGESKSLSIAAASIIAKVYRDKIMIDLDKNHKKYDFCNNKGYGSPIHLEALRQNGVSKIHRKSFLHFLEEQNTLI